MFQLGQNPFAPRFIASLHMVDTVEDWSRVRSPGRARRRMKRGHRQNIKTMLVPKKEAITIDGGRTYMVHPELMQEIRRRFDAENLSP